MKKVPDGWKFGKLQDFIFLQRGFDLTKSEAREGNVPVISSSGISYFHSAAMVEPPGVVTGRKGSLGGVYFVDVPYWPHDTTLWVKDFKGNHPEYVKIFLESLKLERFDAATSVPTLNRNNVHALKVAFPPLTEQRKIAQILSTWDGAIAKMDQLIAALQQRKKGLMQRLLTGEVRFPGFDTEWKETKLEEIAIDFISGGTPSTKVERYWKGNIPWVSSSDFSELRLERINRFITEEAVQNSAAHVVKAGSVLIVTRYLS